jgi:AcrR family transcriptional regulator
MTSRDPDATQHRLLEAARAEFAEHGIAGARVDRIAASARSNKALIYHYFGSKNALFDAVWQQIVTEITEQAPLDVDDLPGYAAELATTFAKDPHFGRLTSWQRLERGEDPPNPFAVASTADKAIAIAEAQRQGLISMRFEATVLMGLLIHIAAFWATSSPDVLAVMKISDADERTKTVRDAVACLLEGAVTQVA